MAKKTIVGTIASAAIALGVSIAEPQEGYVGYVYRDAVGVLTYCYGETENAKSMQGRKFSKQECHGLLVKRMAHYDQGNEACVKNWGTLPVETRGAFNSFSYNVGNGAFCGSTAARYLRSGNIAAACNAMLSWNKGTVKGKKVELPGLTKRRVVERNICLRGVA
ncbi:lysozyme [Rhizobium ruizarguesonis]|uniref:lysozyme n=1 Tax=Rhizobium ruizarguesonis TaxID=2081791 RepID=UPI001030551F|nr:lysozyme [Rhizobium ruizarguesonis]NEI32155.1 glycoside hydrolase family protein [Rhizobium ruizarguesonis]TBB79475.1 lysozyme [Rhizobium ruizarguesonis]